jgi:hypothetical protein
MANSAVTVVDQPYNTLPGNIGRLRSRRVKVTFGADYAAAVLPLITAKQCGLTDVFAVIPEGGASGTAIGALAIPAIAAGFDSFTLALFNGIVPIGTVDESATTVNLLILGR